MKHLLILLLALPMIAFGQRSLLYPTDNVESIVIKDVIHTQLPKKDMYQNAMQWLVKNTSKHSIQLNDSLNGVVISKVAFIISGEKSCKLLSERVYFTITLKFKDNKYKLELDDFFTNPLSSFDGEEFDERKRLGIYSDYCKVSQDSMAMAIEISLLEQNTTSLSNKEKRQNKQRLDKLKEKFRHSSYSCDDYYAYHIKEYECVSSFLNNLKTAIIAKEDW
ncbi:DUF4468 domain-containing protein [uncultured Muribaculum sp.]|uniref:DUF4468 domain-containing protein n=1 Tax=uncultured Muribaculum sp. TaxID=1918613 RepID=UPI0025B7A01C|nr:DUF4468 domain-containing protein [uncultured Muribaculum sp.]